VCYPLFRFQPEVLGKSASTAFIMSSIELFLIKLGCYLLSFGNELAFLDLVAYVGYKYVSLVCVVLASFVAPGWGPLVLWAYTSITFSFFILRSLKFAILPESFSGFFPEEKRKRIHFLLVVAFLQLFFSYFLIVQPSTFLVSGKLRNGP
jgi:protein transport protein YIF1